MKIVTLILFIFFISCCDVITDTYGTHQDAKDNQLFERGWLPDILPTSTTNIKTQNNFDLNTSKGNFKIPKKDLGKFISKLDHILDNNYSYTEKSRYDIWLFEVNSNGYVNYTLSIK